MTVRVKRGVQVIVGDRKIGIHDMSPGEEADPGAVVSIGPPLSGGSEERQQAVLRPGDVMTVGDVHLRAIAMVIGEAGYVDFEVTEEGAS